MKNNVNLEDLETAYSYKSNRQLKFTYFIFNILQNQKLVKLLKSYAKL